MPGEPRCVSDLGYTAVVALHAPHARRVRPLTGRRRGSVGASPGSGCDWRPCHCWLVQVRAQICLFLGQGREEPPVVALKRKSLLGEFLVCSCSLSTVFSPLWICPDTSDS